MVNVDLSQLSDRNHVMFGAPNTQNLHCKVCVMKGTPVLAFEYAFVMVPSMIYSYSGNGMPVAEYIN